MSAKVAVSNKQQQIIENVLAVSMTLAEKCMQLERRIASTVMLQDICVKDPILK